MTEWTPKPGEWVLVQVVGGPDYEGDYTITTGKRRYQFAASSALRPAPVPEPLTELERVVVEAATEWYEQYTGNSASRDRIKATEFLIDAVNALRAARKPRAALTRLKKAWAAVESKQVGAVDEMSAAIAALEAERGDRS
jgi:hypothetical protein